MPVLTLALRALAVLGGIGILLLAAMILEHKSKINKELQRPSGL